MSDTHPYAPEGVDRIGAPPVNGEGGERGTSAFDGDPTAQTDEGPARGVDYHDAADPAPITTQGDYGRSPATAEDGGAPDQLDSTGAVTTNGGTGDGHAS